MAAFRTQLAKLTLRCIESCEACNKGGLSRILELNKRLSEFESLRSEMDALLSGHPWLPREPLFVQKQAQWVKEREEEERREVEEILSSGDLEKNPSRFLLNLIGNGTLTIEDVSLR